MCNCRFDGIKWNSDQRWNNHKCRCECKEHHEKKKKKCVWSPVTSSRKNRKYLVSITDDSAIRFGETIESYNEETKTIPTNFNEEM